MSLFSGLTSAQIEILPPANLPGVVKFLLNPKELRVQRSAQWDSTPQPAADGGGRLQFHGTSPRTTSFEAFFDTFMSIFQGTPQPPEVAVTMLQMAMEKSDATEAMGDPQPPMVTFQWGSKIIFPQAVITQCDEGYDRNWPIGGRTRSTVNISLMEVPSIVPGTNPTSGGLATRRTHAVIEGDTLASVAFEQYKDPNKWRALAEVNGIDDPMRLAPGTVLIVPELREIDSLA